MLNLILINPIIIYFTLQTYIGDILVAVNPYKDLDLYNKEV